MAKKINPSDVKEGMVVKSNKGNFIAMWSARFNRRSHTVLHGVYEKDLSTMLKNPKDTTKMRFITWTFRKGEPIELISSVPLTTTKKLQTMNALMNAAIEQRRVGNMDKLNLKWNPNAEVKNSSGRRWMGANDVMTLKGEHVKAGDVVMVQFSNGKFDMVMGNDKGQTYDGSTGRFYCRSPWKVGARPSHKLVYHPTKGLHVQISKSKARSMPPESLLYLIKKKEDTHGMY